MSEFYIGLLYGIIIGVTLTLNIISISLRYINKKGVKNSENDN